MAGYRKMGYQALENKIVACRQSTHPWLVWRYIRCKGRARDLAYAHIHFEQQGELQISQTPRCEQMATVIRQQGYSKTKLCLLQDLAFFEWRFNCKRHKYVFYYLVTDEMVLAYLVVNVSADNETARFVDYAEAKPGTLQTIIARIIRSKQFAKLEIYTYGADDTLSHSLQAYGFSCQTWLGKIKQACGGQRGPILPLLIRPSKSIFTEQDFIVHGLDVRYIRSWQLKPICSDAA